MANAANRLPRPGSNMVNSVVKFAVDKSCKATAVAIFRERGTSVSANDIQVVSKQMCDMVNFTTDLLLKSSSGKEIKATDVGLHLISQNVNVTRLSHSQQLLCGAAIVDLAISGYKMVNECKSTVAETTTGAEIGGIGGPELAVLFSTVTFGSHVPELASKSAKLVNAALDAYSLCGPLVFDKVAKPRVVASPGPMQATITQRPLP